MSNLTPTEKIKEELLKDFDEIGEIYTFPRGIDFAIGYKRGNEHTSSTPFDGKWSNNEIKQLLSDALSTLEAQVRGDTEKR
jgi:hypothetical protein